MTDESPNRPRAELGELLRDTLRCPMRHGGIEAMLGMSNPNAKPLRIVAFRPRSVRLECRECGLRFSIDPENLADTIVRREAPTAAEIERQARERSADDPRQYLANLALLKD